MMKYLIILLDESSPSFCHYTVKHREAKLISYDHLAAGIRFAMAENLTVQLVYPSYPLPIDYMELIDTVDHSKIASVNAAIDVDARICDSFDQLSSLPQNAIAILRVTTKEFIKQSNKLLKHVDRLCRVNIVFTDIDSLSEDVFAKYELVLEELSESIQSKLRENPNISLNILTDRLFLTGSNQCNAGVDSLTLAPNGKLYICPAFYYDEEECVGTPENGYFIPNAQLLRLDHAPICRKCDAWQCRRCVWLNKKMTWDINTPSHEQCVLSHLERNAAQSIQKQLMIDGWKFAHPIPNISYLDPFDITNKFSK